MPAPTILTLASYFKGNRFLQAVSAHGGRVILVTIESRRHEPWAFDAITEYHVVRDFQDLKRLAVDLVPLLRRLPFDAIVALDDFDVEVAASLREQFRILGPGVTEASVFRDKLAMRERAQQLGIRIPEFVAAVHDPAIVAFLTRVPGPWLVKPRSDASAAGIRKCHTPQQVWDRLDELGDRRYGHLIEEMVPGELFHVDSLMTQGNIVLSEVNAYWRPLLDVYHNGEVYATRTLDRSALLGNRLRDINAQVLHGFGHTSGASHTEFMRAHRDQELYFIETSCRVGGAETATMIEAATGINLWAEWAAIEVARIGGVAYQLPPTISRHAGVVLSLARTEAPETSSFTDPEIVERLCIPHHIGLVIAAENATRIDDLLANYIMRIRQDFHATMPAAETVAN